jgi:hypothetical protein
MRRCNLLLKKNDDGPRPEEELENNMMKENPREPNDEPRRMTRDEDGGVRNR